MRRTALLILLFLPIVTYAQNVKLINSSSTDWSGGVAGHAGTRYTFTIECSGFDRAAFTLDTIWIGNDPTRLLVKIDDKTAFNTVCKAGKKSIVYTINLAVDRSFHTSVEDPYSSGNKTIKTAKPPLKYKGVALLSYHYKGKPYHFVIDKTTIKYPPISYP